MNILPSAIKDLLVVVEEQLKHPNSDKKAGRRTRAVLEEAYYISLAIFPERGPNAQPAAAVSGKCICPPGATDRVTCPVHKA